MILPLCSDSQMNKCTLPISGAKFQPAKPPHLTSTTEQILSAVLGQLILPKDTIQKIAAYQNKPVLWT